MGYFPVRYYSRVVIYERKMFIRLATDVGIKSSQTFPKEVDTSYILFRKIFFVAGNRTQVTPIKVPCKTVPWTA